MYFWIISREFLSSVQNLNLRNQVTDVLSYFEVSQSKRVNSILNTIWVNSLRLGVLQISCANLLNKTVKIIWYKVNTNYDFMTVHMLKNSITIKKY